MSTATLTRESILAMEAGAEMDALVAERVMGFGTASLDSVDFWLDPKPGTGLRAVFSWSPSTDIAAAWEVEDRIDRLANFRGEIVEHVTVSGNTTHTRGLHLRERYVCHLLRIVSVPEFSLTCMGNNNWIGHRFRSDELWALARATPLDRCRAALLATLEAA